MENNIKMDDTEIGYEREMNSPGSYSIKGYFCEHQSEPPGSVRTRNSLTSSSEKMNI
jgi:hypothetical protein